MVTGIEPERGSPITVKARSGPDERQWCDPCHGSESTVALKGMVLGQRATATEGSELRRRRRRSAANQHRGGYRLVEPATTIITVVAATVIGSPVPSIGPERWRPENFTTTLATLTPSWDDCHVGVQNGGGGRPSRRDQWQHTDGDPGPTNYITPRFLVNELEGCGWSELVAGTSTSGIVQWKVYTVEIKYTIKYKWNKNLSYKGIGWKSIIFRTYHLSQ